MKPIEFKEQNTILGKPPSMTDEECGSLPCYRDGMEVVSKWRLTEEEIQHVVEHGFIWLRLFSGETQPPVCLEAKTEIFEEFEGHGRIIHKLFPSEIK